MKYKVDHIPMIPQRRPGRKITPKYLTIHSTGNPSSTAQNERDNLAREGNTRSASFHLVVDEKEVIECIPLNEIAYHAGTSAGNSQSIGIEICESGDRHKTMKNAVKLTAKVLSDMGWGTDRLRRHYDWSGKICPRILADNNWKNWHNFVNDVTIELEGVVGDTVSNWAVEAWNWAQEKGITDGSKPQEPATREQIITMLHRYHKSLSK